MTSASRFLLAAVVPCLLFTHSVRAEESSNAPIGREQMLRLMHRYFDEEKQEGGVFGGVGALSILSGTGLLIAAAAHDPAAITERSAAWPILSVGVLQFAIGVATSVRADGQINDRDQLMSTNPAEFLRAERARMDYVNLRFKVLLSVEAAAIIAGTIMTAVGGTRNNPTVEGVGIGFLAQGLVTSVLDYFAAGRSDDYAKALQRFDPKLE